MNNHIAHRCLFILIGLILAGGFYLRYKSIHETIVAQPLTHDAGDYFRYAYNLKHKNIYSSEAACNQNENCMLTPDAVRSPGYPLFLTFFVDGMVSEEMIKNILVSQMIISILTIFIAFLFFQSFLYKFWAVMASLLVALSPHLIIANSYILTETLFCFLIVLTGWLISLFVARPSSWSASFIGIAIGMASLVRPSLQYLLVVILFFFVFYFQRKKWIKFFIIMLIGFIIVLSPWVIRNIFTLKIISDKCLMINFLHHGMYPDFIFNDDPKSYGFPYLYDPCSKKISKNTTSVLKEITRRFKEEPWKHFRWFFLKKPVVFWSWDLVQGGDVFIYRVSTSPFFSNKVFKLTHKLMYYIHWPLVFLGMFGSLVVWLPISIIKVPEKSIVVLRFVSIFLIYFIFIHIVGAPFPRYSIPLRPFLYGMAMFTLYFLILKFRTQKLLKSCLFQGE